MSKLKLDNIVGDKKESQMDVDKVLKLTGTAIKNLKELSNAFDSFQKGVERSKKADVENAAKLEKVRNEAKQEENRHSAAMAKIEFEYERLKKDYEKGELALSMISDLVQQIRAQSDKLLSMRDEQYLGASEIQKDLNKTMIEIAKELLR